MKGRDNMKIDIPADVCQIMDTLTGKSHEAYIVGGCVRDSIRDVVPKDWDITTSATPNQVVEIFPKTFETGVKHGTITVLINRRAYEVTTFRVDGAYLDCRRPEEVIFTADIKEDLSRRDFTMNAIAYNLKHGFVDPFDGHGDIDRKIIRCVGDANARFGEDALRMLRAVRFAGQLGFTVDDEILKAIMINKENLANISAERIREELTKLLCSPYVEAAEILARTGMLSFILKGHEFGGDYAMTLRLLRDCPAHEALRLAIFLAWSGEACEKILRSLRFDNKTIKEVSQYVRLLSDDIPLDRYGIKKYLRHISQAHFENLLTLQAIIRPDDASRLEDIRQESRDIQDSGECYTIGNLTVNGEDLVMAGVPRGKAIGDKLEELLDAVMLEPELNNRLRELF